jgi:hypothetical protein
MKPWCNSAVCTAHLAHQRALGPERTGAVEVGLHLTAHVAVASGRTENDGVVLSQFVWRSYRNVAKSFLGAGFVQHILGQRFRHPLDDDLIAGNFAGSFGKALRQLVDMPVSGIKQNQGFHCD